jgi:hypothetical protein
MNFKRIVGLISFLALSLSSQAWAGYYTVLDNNEILDRGHYKLGADTQFLTNGDGGVNLGVNGDIGIDDEWGARALLGFGKTDFFMGGLVKWVPIPDVDNQPAIGVNAGVLYAKWEGDSDFTLRAEPIISKKFDLNGTVLTPYASIPVGLRFRDNSVENRTDFVSQLVVGSQLEVASLKKVQFMGEIGMDLHESPAYISLSALIYFDEENGLKFE